MWHPDRRYSSRSEAGKILAREVSRLNRHDLGPQTVVLGLPRGGLPVAAPVARQLRCSLAALPVRKVGLPWRPELAMGALAGIGDEVVVARNEQVLARAGVSEDAFRVACARESVSLRRALRLLQRDTGAPAVAGRAVIVVDDGLATGATMRAAVLALRRVEVAAIVIAVPIASSVTASELRAEVDDLVCPWYPRSFRSVQQGYLDFGQLTDQDVRAVLAGTDEQ